jgi:cellulose biosynthesis protein BcsQ
LSAIRSGITIDCEDIKGTICAVGGGKGVGKTLVAVNTACALALDGYEVILVDADLAGANLHTLFGIKRLPVTLNEFVRRTIGKIDDLLVPTALRNLRLVCGATDFIDLANPGHARKADHRAIGNMARISSWSTSAPGRLSTTSISSIWPTWGSSS